jgi:hypothetical protein
VPAQALCAADVASPDDAAGLIDELGRLRQSLMSGL